jgi:hypothetical protein
MERRPPRWTLLCNSHAGLWGGFGQGPYALANATLSGIEGPGIVNVCWDRWQGVGMAKLSETEHRQRHGQILPGGLPPAEMLKAFQQLLDLAITGQACEGPWLVSGRSPQTLRAERLTTAMAAASTPHRQGAAGTGPAPLGGASSAATSLASRPDHLGPVQAPNSDLERRLIPIWEARLGVAPLGVRDDFFALGGDSLIALGLAGLIRQELGLSVPLKALLTHRTIEGLANFLQSAPSIADGQEEMAAPAASPSEKPPAPDASAFEEGRL